MACVPKPDFCKSCPINHVTQGYTPLRLRPGTVLDVGEASGEDEVRSGEGFSGPSGRWLKNMHARAGQKWETISTLNVIGCHPPDNIYPLDEKWHATSKADAVAGVAHCAKHHFWPALARANRPRINAIGASALTALTGKHGIHTWRGSPLALRTDPTRARVMPMLHPAALMRSAKFVSVTVGDMRKPLVIPPEHYNLQPSLADLQRWRSKVFAFDFEWDRDGISICGLSDRFYGAVVVPFMEPYHSELRRIFEEAECLIGHNIIGADLSWIERMGWRLRPDLRIEDTMLKQHLCQPDYPHDLGFVASIFTQKPFWKGHGWSEVDEESEGDDAPGQQWRTWNLASATPRALGGYGGCRSAQEAFALYNARDTDAEFQINTPLQHMLDKWDLTHVYRDVSLPAAYICRWIGERGLRIDTSRLAAIRVEVDRKIVELESTLPDGLRPYDRTVVANLPAPPGTYRPSIKVCKGTRKNPHSPMEHPFFAPTDAPIECQMCGKVLKPGKMHEAKILKGTRQERVVPYNSPPRVAAYVASCALKEVIDRKSGRRTTGARARGIWAKEHPEFTQLGALKEQVTLRNNFAKDSLLRVDRMFFNLKVHGTSEGRLSASGRRRGIDLNIQNQPEEFRAIYVPDHADWGFLNIDISQGESWLTCWLAKDWVRWEKLQTPGYDEHGELAGAIFGVEIGKKHKPEYWAAAHPDWTEEQCRVAAAPWNAKRQIGKKTNHASSYGMGYRKYLEILMGEGYTEYKESDTREFLETWKKINVRTCEWQRETQALAESQGFLVNPFGRIRWFTSHSIGTECLAFLPASSLADMVIRMMICHYPTEFLDSITRNGQETFAPLAPEWVMSAMVHDSLLLQGPWAARDEQRERSEGIMTQSWKELDGFRFKVDVKSSQVSWGDCA